MPRILGIDPGLRHTGFALIDCEGSLFRHIDSGVISPDPKLEIQSFPEHALTSIRKTTI